MLQRLRQFLVRDLAVDLGTANTRIAAAGQGLVLCEPSVVAVAGPSGPRLPRPSAVGHLARQMAGRTPETVSVVQPVREGAIAHSELCEAMLGHFLRKVQSRPWQRPRLMVAVSGAITPVEKRALVTSALRAGGGELLVIGKAKAAALGAGLAITEPLAQMVCEIGGGTTEIAVLSLADVVADQSLRVGGEQMDQAIVDCLRRNYSLRIGRAEAERLRIEIGSAWPLDEERADEVRGVDFPSGLPRRATITSEEVRQALGEPLERIVDGLKTTVDRCSPDLAADLFDQGVVLTGGAALLAGLARFITERTGLPARVAPESSTAVVEGALLCLENLGQWRGTWEPGDEG